MTQYYFLATILPPLNFDSEPEITLDEAIGLLFINFTKSDYEMLQMIRRLMDLYNLRALWLKEPVSHLGSMTKSALHDAAATYSGLPDYCLDFLQKYPETSARLAHFQVLLSNFFQYEKISSDGIVKKYFDFEHSFYVTKVALRARKLGRDLLKELEFEDPDADEVFNAVSQKDRPDFEPQEGFEPLKLIYESHADNALSMFLEVCRWRFNTFAEWRENDAFSTESIIAYVLQLMELEKIQRIQK